MKIGIMGGTFNPIHNGHLLIAENAYWQFKLDEIRFMPAGIPPHKQNMGILDGDIRCAMVQQAIKDIPYFSIDKREVQASDISYTYKTLEKMHLESPNDSFYFIMGADSLLYFDKWAKPEEILKYATVLAAARDAVEVSEIKEKIQMITSKLGGNMDYIKTPAFNVSSQEIRSRIAANESIRYLVPDDVRTYITDNRLYR